MGKKKNNWQDTDYVLKLFNSKLSLARRRYREYVKKGISVGKRPDLIGGGLVRSAGGWDALKGLRKIKVDCGTFLDILISRTIYVIRDICHAAQE